MKIDFPSNYKGFELISIKDVPDCASTGIYLRHKETGLEVFHLVNDDPENLFSFSFRTPIKNATGAAHILEHSVLCGSEKFPLKEPFTNMMNQSVNTFLNAMTYADKTVYPASSVVKNDYFNLMDVYADAVFFPLLKKETFLQEARRLELNDSGEFEMQGVVYNEMKGCYSSFDSVASDIQLRSIFPNTNYSLDSGGDPLVIPLFTYEDFKAFHQKYYSPDNCLLFLYGNIPTQEQLDFIDKILINRLKQKYPLATEKPSYPYDNPEFREMETSSEIKESLVINKTAPTAGATGSLVTVNWNCGETKNLEDFMECAFLSEVLIGNDGSPLAKALLDSELGDELAPISGVNNETRNFSISFGLHGVKKGNEKKVYKVLFSALDEIFNQGIEKSHIDAAIMSAEFSNREVTRAGGPYSLVLLERALSTWNYGTEPALGLLYRDAFEKVRIKAEENPRYIQELLLKYIYENKKCVYVTVSPSEKYIKERDEKEKKLIQELSKTVDKESLKKDLDALHAYQQYHETEKDVECIPSLKLSDLSTEANVIHTDFSFLSLERQCAKVPVLRNIENTNGIAYLELGFPLDAFEPEDYFYLPLFNYVAPSCGWKDKDWAETSLETGMYTGGISSRLFVHQRAQTERSKALQKEREKHNVIGHDWIFFSVKLLSEKLDEGLKTFEDFITGFNFSDEKRLKNLLGEVKSGLKASVIPHGNRYALTRVQAFNSHSGVVDEITKGFSQIMFIDSLSEKNVKELSKRLGRIKEKLLSAGTLVHLTTDKETDEKLSEKLPVFLEKLSIKELQAPKAQDDQAFFNKILMKGEQSADDAKEEYFTAETQVGFSAAATDSNYFQTVENAREIFLSHWLSVTLLWERIRTTGGAYGAYASSANLSGQFLFSSFRDPSPVKSIQTFKKCLEDASEISISEEECSRSLTGTYGDEVQPLSPSARGRAGLLRYLYCISDEDRSEKLKNIVSLKPEDLAKAARFLSDPARVTRTCVLLNKNDKNIKKSSVIINLHL